MVMVLNYFKIKMNILVSFQKESNSDMDSIHGNKIKFLWDILIKMASDKVMEYGNKIKIVN